MKTVASAFHLITTALHTVPPSTMSPVVIITGAVSTSSLDNCSVTSLRLHQNRGVGLGIVHRILASSDPYTLYLTSRSGNDLPKAKDPHTFHSAKLDVSDSASIKAFAARVEKEQGKGGVDALINNAGLNVDQDKGYNKEAVHETMKTNFYGTRGVSSRVSHRSFR